MTYNDKFDPTGWGLDKLTGDGFVDPSTETVANIFTGTPSFGTDYTDTSPVGHYRIWIDNADTLTAQNYVVKLPSVDGDLECVALLIPKPTVKDPQLVYDGTEQTGVNIDPAHSPKYYSVAGEKAKDVSTDPAGYTFVATLTDPSVKWDNGTAPADTDPVTLKWNLLKKEVTSPSPAIP